MANSINDFSQIVYPLADALAPQQLTSGTTNGAGVAIYPVGVDRISAMLATGAAVGLTSLTVTMQASIDNVTWVNCTDQGNNETFNVVTAGNQVPQIITFQVPPATSFTSGPYKYVRAQAVVVGTSIYAHVALLGVSKFGGLGAGNQNQPPTIS